MVIKWLFGFIVSIMILTSQTLIAGEWVEKKTINYIRTCYDPGIEVLCLKTTEETLVNPDNCSVEDEYRMPDSVERKVSTFTAYLLMAIATDREISFHVDGCSNNRPRIANIKLVN